MKVKKCMGILMTGILGISLTACGGTTESKESSESKESTESKSGTITVGYSVQSMENTYYISIIEGMKAAAKEKGIQLIISDAGADASKHIDHIDDFISQGVDAIIISPVDEKAPENAIKEAQNAGIPVISFCQKVEGADAFYGTSEEEYGIQGGKIAGMWLNEKEEDGTIEEVLDDEGKIEVVVNKYDTIASLIARGNGLKEGLEETYTGDKEIVYVYEQDGADADTGYKIAETALTANPKASIFLGINDSAALGMYEAVLTNKEHTPENTCITGLDALPEALDLIANDTMYKGTVDIQPAKQGAKVLDIVKEVLENGPIEEPVYADMKIVTKENISDYETN